MLARTSRARIHPPDGRQAVPSNPAGGSRAGREAGAATDLATILQHTVELAVRRAGEDWWRMQARTLGELGYTIVGKDVAATYEKCAVQLAELDRLHARDEAATEVVSALRLAYQTPRRGMGDGLIPDGALADALDQLVRTHELHQRAQP
jgi:hypothetical protein